MDHFNGYIYIKSLFTNSVFLNNKSNILLMKLKTSFGILFIITLLFVSNATATIHLPPKAIKRAADISYIVESTGNILTWQYEAEESNDDPTIYNITIDGLLLSDHTNKEWKDKVDIKVIVVGLYVGSHTVEITVFDSGVPDFADAATDQAIVTVVTSSENLNNNESKSSNSPINLNYILLSLFSIIIIRFIYNM